MALENISFLEKGILTQIIYYNNTEGCHASNAHIGSIFNISIPTVTRAVTKLKRLKYIEYKGYHGKFRRLNTLVKMTNVPTDTNQIDEGTLVKMITNTNQNDEQKVKRKKSIKKEIVPKTAPDSSLFRKAQHLMEEIHGENFLNYKKEMPCLKRFIAQIEQKNPSNPWPLIEGMIYQFAEMKQEDRTAKGYWRDMDFTPSKLIANAESIYEKFKQRTKEEKIDEETRELIKSMRL